MNISFLEDDPLDTVILNSADGKPLYEVQTPWKFPKSTTFIRRTVPGIPAGSGPLVAEVHWHAFSSDTISFCGSTMPIYTFLRESGVWSSSRIMTGTDGRQYKWKVDSGSLRLIDNHTKAVIAEPHHSKIGWFSAPRDMNIDIRPSGMEILDAIVVSFILMEHALRQRRKQAASSAMVAGAGAGAGAGAAAPSC